MIVFDLRCPVGHVFEAWFGSGDDYAAQQERGLVSCPVCGAGGIEKAAMAPAVPAKSNGAGAGLAMASAPDPAKMKAVLAAMARAQAEMLSGSEHVGRRFAEEARAIHVGEADARTIHGEASIAEAKSLAEDGIAVMPLPLPVRQPGRDN